MIKEITEPQTWSNFLLTLQPNTFLQSWEWGQVQQNDGEEVKYLGIFENGQQVGACLLLTINARRGRHFLIPHGPIFTTEEQARKYLPQIVQYLRDTPDVSRSDSSGVAKRGSSAVALRISPLLIDSPENLHAFQNLGFRSAPRHVHAELTWVLDINKPEEELLSGMRKTTRQAIRKAEQADVNAEVFSDSSALDRFWPLYQQTKDRHDFVPYSRRLLEIQLKHMNSFTVIASHQGQDVAAGIFFQFGKTVFYYHGASIKTPSKISPAQLLQWKAIQAAKRRGATRFNFWGIAPDSEPGSESGKKHPFAGITIFKKGFGGYALNYMHAQDLPLSFGYITLWLADTYRRSKRGF